MAEARRTVALVDDEPSILRALSRLVGSAGFEPQAFASGTEFLGAMPIPGLRCVVLDIHMPEVSGLEVQTRLAHQWPGVPVIFITGHEDPEAQRRALAARPLAFLNKPINSTHLLNAIDGVR
jgi:FixJ family two-component response regulator